MTSTSKERKKVSELKSGEAPIYEPQRCSLNHRESSWEIVPFEEPRILSSGSPRSRKGPGDCGLCLIKPNLYTLYIVGIEATCLGQPYYHLETRLATQISLSGSLRRPV